MSQLCKGGGSYERSQYERVCSHLVSVLELVLVLVLVLVLGWFWFNQLHQ